MAPKRSREEDGDVPSALAPESKKARKGFRVGPENLPDGPWRRKVTKIKKGLIEKAKIKKAYAKIKAAEQQSSSAAAPPADGEPGDAEPAASAPQVHPERQAMLDEEPEADVAAEGGAESKSDKPARLRQQRPRQKRKPGYYDKALAEAERKKAEAEERRKEMERRTEERNRKVRERETFRKAMIKAKTPGRDGKRKLGRESGLLLEKVKSIVNDKK